MARKTGATERQGYTTANNASALAISRHSTARNGILDRRITKMQKHEEALIVVTSKLTTTQIETLERLMVITGKTRSELLREACEYLFQVYKTDLQD